MMRRDNRSLSDLIRALVDKEDESVIKAMAFMTYNPSIGRVMEKNGVESFAKMATTRVSMLNKIRSINEFDSFHRSWVAEIIGKIHRNTRGGGEKCSYGQAQKPINVFLKVYVDWASRPDTRTADRLRPWLHVPLDSIVMGKMSERFTEEFEKNIHPFQGDSLSLSSIERGLYERWQKLFRTMYPNKPLLFDIVRSTWRR